MRIIECELTGNISAEETSPERAGQRRSLGRRRRRNSDDGGRMDNDTTVRSGSDPRRGQQLKSDLLHVAIVDIYCSLKKMINAHCYNQGLTNGANGHEAN